MTSDFTFGSSSPSVQWGPVADRDGAAFVFLLGDENTVFIDGGDSTTLAVGDSCSKLPHNNRCNTTFPATCLFFDDFADETILACNGTVVGSLSLEFVEGETDNTPVPPGTGDIFLG